MKLVVLTKSAKRMHDGSYGNCVAGISEQGQWIRLVSDDDGDSLSDETCRAFNCLDVIEVDVKPCPLEYQPENAKLERFIKRAGRITIDDVIEKFGVSNEHYCFVNSESMLNEREMRLADKSLIILKVQDLEIYLDDRSKPKVNFTYNRLQYTHISITDNRHKKPIEYDEAYIVVSLPSDSNGYSGYYKFIAAIYPI